MKNRSKINGWTTKEAVFLILIMVLIAGFGTMLCHAQRIYVHNQLAEIIKKQDQIIQVLYAPPVYEKKILFYEAADPYDTTTPTKAPKRIK